MRRIKTVFIAGMALLFAAAAFCSNPLPEDTMYAVRRMLRVAQKPLPHVLTLDYEAIEPEYNLPEVFFGIRLKGDWPVERRKAALDAYLAVMADTDFTDYTNNDRDLPFKATAQCVSMNYTNALPYMRRLVLNPTLPGWKRRDEIGRLIRFSPVSDETTATMEAIFTNRVDFTWKDRAKCFEYAAKVVTASQSNLVSQSICDRAARIFTRDPTEWQLAGEYDYFWENYYSGYAMSSNRLQFVNNALTNTNLTQDSDWRYLKDGLIAVTNELHSSGQPLTQLNIDFGGN